MTMTTDTERVAEQLRRRAVRRARRARTAASPVPEVVVEPEPTEPTAVDVVEEALRRATASRCATALQIALARALDREEA
jgi:hypothetical protein